MVNLLADLHQQGLCDDSTRDALHMNDPFILEQVALIHQQATPLPKEPTPHNENEPQQDTQHANTPYSLGKKLLFLENLLQEPQNIQEQVKTWLAEDDKRRFLFNHSPQADLYGELLVAKAYGTLEQLRKQHNPNATPHQQYTYTKTLDVLATREEPLKLIEEKLEKVLANIAEQSAFGKDIGQLDHALQTITRAKKPAHVFAKKTRTLRRTLIGDSSAINTLYSCGGYFCEGLRSESIRKITEAFETDKTEIAAEQQHALDNIRKEIHTSDGDYITFDDDIAHALNLTREHVNELNALAQQYHLITMQGSDKKLSDKIKEGKKLTYSLKLSEKDPLDVRFGNDNGCCIGVYPNSKNIGNAYGLPHTIADNAQYLFDVVHANGNEKRVGIVYAFDCTDPKSKRTLVCNSLELSPSMNPYKTLGDIVTFIEDGLADFAQKNGFDRVVMSTHTYNTSANRSTRTANTTTDTFTKKSAKNEPPFYSEIFHDKQTTSSRQFYTLWERA